MAPKIPDSAKGCKPGRLPFGDAGTPNASLGSPHTVGAPALDESSGERAVKELEKKEKARLVRSDRWCVHPRPTSRQTSSPNDRLCHRLKMWEAPRVLFCPVVRRHMMTPRGATHLFWNTFR